MTEPVVAPKRPVVLTVVLVLAYLSALVDVAVGILVFLSRYDVPDDAVFVVSLLGAATILLGLLQLAVAAGVGRGSHLSRILLTVFIGALFVLDAATITSTVLEGGGWDAIGVIDVLVELFILGVLWLPPGSRYFRAMAEYRQAAPVA